MGVFGTYLFDGTRWTEQDSEDEPTAAGPWLWIDIHDSDVATVKYRPIGPGTGIAFLGFTPRVYFEDDSASDPTDVDREANGLAAWWGDSTPGLMTGTAGPSPGSCRPSEARRPVGVGPASDDEHWSVVLGQDRRLDLDHVVGPDREKQASFSFPAP